MLNFIKCLFSFYLDDHIVFTFHSVNVAYITLIDLLMSNLAYQE